MSTLNVRINQKFDTLNAWLGSSIILGAGEIAVAQIPAQQTDSGLTPPAVGIKVGDGTKTFAQLDWIQAVAGDVPSWAKAATKPVYKASEIEELESFIAGEIQDTNTQYSFAYENGVLTIKSKEVTEEEWSDLASFNLNLEVKADKVVGAVAGNLAALDADGNLVDAGAKIGDYVTTSAADAKYETIETVSALEETVSGVAERVGTAEGKITTLEGQVATLNGEGEGSVKKAAEDAAAAAVNAFATEVTDNGQVEKFKELVDWVADHGSEAGEMADGIQANAEAIDALEEKAHTHENATVINAITAEQVTAWDKAVTDLATEVQGRAQADQAFTAEDERLAGLIDGNADAIEALQEVSHTHANKAELDLIATGDKAKWDAAVQTVSGVETTKTGTDVAVTAVPVTLLKNVEGNTLVFECGTASTVL